jgi:hypothetical protein
MFCNASSGATEFIADGAANSSAIGGTAFLATVSMAWANE